MMTMEVKDYKKSPIRNILESKPKWIRQGYREAYMEAAIEQGVAWQIRINRNARRMTQTQLARLINTKQSAISRMEDPTYGAHSLDTLIEVAKAFDCALSVKFVSYSQLAYDSEKLAESDIFAAPFKLELEELHGKEVHV